MAFTFELLRPDDLLALRFAVVNLKLDVSDGNHPRLVVDQPTRAAYLIIELGPQSITEKAYFEVAQNVPDNSPTPQSSDDPLDAPGSVPARMAGSSRLVFRLPAGVTQIPFRMDALLDWSKLELVLSPTARGEPTAPPLTAPSALQTALEIPYRLILSPADRVGWLHGKQAATHAGRTELWHTRLGRFVKVKTKAASQSRLREASEDNTVPLRAIWSPDFVDHGILPAPGDNGPFLSAMSPRDRAEIVILTSGVSGYFVEDIQGNVSPWTPRPIRASRLFLSALGGWLSSRGAWPSQPSYTPSDGGPTQSLDISEWDHVATQARDHYVRVVYEGFLYPFGHRAALIKVTERKVVPPGGVVDYPTAYLKQHMYVVVREPVKTYATAPYSFGGREMPFWQSIRVRTHVTPDIDKPSFLPDGSATPASFWINVGGSGFPFLLTATDLAGHAVDFVAQLIFMTESEASPAAIGALYKASGQRRQCQVSGQRIAYADPSLGDTTLKTSGLYFDSEILQNTPPFPEVPFIPTLDQAMVTVPAVEQMLGTSAPITIQLYDRYLSSGIDAHAAVFAEIAGTAPTVAFSAEQSGGFATPALALTALSARKGLVAGSPDDAAEGLIKPSEFFDLGAKLFGTVPLQALIPVDANGKAPADQNAPVIRSKLKPSAKNPDTRITEVSWSPALQRYEQDPVTVEINQDGQSSVLSLQAQISQSLKGGPAASQIHGELTHFMVTLLGVVGIKFNGLKFSSENGQKMKVKADLAATDPIGFIGPLEFVQKLADILPPGIFGGKGPSIDLKPDKISVSYTLGLPPISIGVFALEHISITTGLDLPYLDGKPAFEFAFAKRSSPFLLTVECLGGGGFVHLIIDADGVQMVEGALEFGGEFSLDLGVASGGVHIMAGIYFQLAGSNSDLTGFVDVGGEVSVLGIISISLDLNLSLSYQVSNGKKMVEGRATLTVSVHVLFFSASVQISMEKSFGSDSGDPRIADVIDAAEWATYAGAFA